MKNRWKRMVVVGASFIFAAAAFYSSPESHFAMPITTAQSMPTPTPAPAMPGEFDQPAAIAKLREQIKGKESEPSDKVFKNIQILKAVPAGRLLAIMEMGYSRSLGVNCTHCHTPEKWDDEGKTQKQVARDMFGMMAKINGELLKNIKNLKSASPTVNCTTCHRGEIKPALNLNSK